MKIFAVISKKKMFFLSLTMRFLNKFFNKVNLISRTSTYQYGTYYLKSFDNHHDLFKANKMPTFKGWFVFTLRPYKIN